MIEYINIISKEDVKAVPTELAAIGGIIAILAVLSTFVYWAFVKDSFRVCKYLGIVGSIAVVFSVAWMCITCIFFSEPTGQYNYKATIDKDNITVTEYEQFMKEYHPNIKDDVYYFTAGELE